MLNDSIRHTQRDALSPCLNYLLENSVSHCNLPTYIAWPVSKQQAPHQGYPSNRCIGYYYHHNVVLYWAGREDTFTTMIKSTLLLLSHSLCGWQIQKQNKRNAFMASTQSLIHIHGGILWHAWVRSFIRHACWSHSITLHVSYNQRLVQYQIGVIWSTIWQQGDVQGGDNVRVTWLCSI